MKKYTKIMAAVLAATMSASAFATSVPGLPTDVFEFSQPGIQDMPTTGPGLGAITQIEDILTAIKDTQGSNIDLDKFWSAFVADEEANVFDYGNAEQMIAELIFTVTGEAYGFANSTFDWHAAADASITVKEGDTTIYVGDAYTYYSTMAKSNVTGAAATDFYVDGKLSGTKTAAIALLQQLGLHSDGTLITRTTAATAGDVTTAIGSDAASVLAVGDVAVSNAEVAALAAAGSIDTSSAAVNVKGFNNANALIALIADQLTTGYILDASAAALAVKDIADQHNGYLGARIVHDAKSIKAIIKAIGVQEAAVGLGYGTAAACRGTTSGVNDTNNGTACTDVGSEYVGLLALLPADTDTIAEDYVTALQNIDTIVTAITTFNVGIIATAADVLAAADAASNGNLTGNETDAELANLAGFGVGDVTAVAAFDGYGDGSAAGDAIETQFGTITVVDNTGTAGFSGSLYENLTDGTISNNFDLEDATNNTGLFNDSDFDFVESIDIAGETLDLF